MMLYSPINKQRETQSAPYRRRTLQPLQTLQYTTDIACVARRMAVACGRLKGNSLTSTWGFEL